MTAVDNAAIVWTIAIVVIAVGIASIGISTQPETNTIQSEEVPTRGIMDMTMGVAGNFMFSSCVKDGSLADCQYLCHKDGAGSQTCAKLCEITDGKKGCY